ncbi:hypothetical protein QE439_002587 [Pedobacter agri]|nr:hypothetical protein [Pedobacter agri]
MDEENNPRIGAKHAYIDTVTYILYPTNSIVLKGYSVSVR